MDKINSEKDLENKGAKFELIILNQVVHSVHDVQIVCHCEAREVIKTLVFVGTKPIVVILPGDKKADITKIEKLTGEQNLRMAKPEEVLTITGYSVGSVTPFGIDSEIKQIAETSVSNLPSLILGSGKNDVLIKINQAEFAKSFQGSFASISI